MSSSHVKSVQCSPAMLGFSSYKINIPQHINPLGTGDLKFYQSQETGYFLGTFDFFNETSHVN